MELINDLFLASCGQGVIYPNIKGVSSNNKDSLTAVHPCGSTEGFSAPICTFDFGLSHPEADWPVSKQVNFLFFKYLMAAFSTSPTSCYRKNKSRACSVTWPKCFSHSFNATSSLRRETPGQLLIYRPSAPPRAVKTL